jgi:hypothetical protein
MPANSRWDLIQGFKVKKERNTDLEISKPCG